MHQVRATNCQLVLYSIWIVTTMAVVPVTARELIFDTAAEHFTESCPIGNGRLGGMMFGDVEHERIVLNESGMWSGSPQQADRPEAHRALPEIRRLLLAGKNDEAEALVNRNFTCAGGGSGRGRGAEIPYGCYQMLGNLVLRFYHRESESQAQDYHRSLDLQTAIAALSYRMGNVLYRRELFASLKDDVIVMQLSADQPGCISLDIAIARPGNAKSAVHDGTLVMTGQLHDGQDNRPTGGGTGAHFSAAVHVVPQGGTISEHDGQLRVRDADTVQLIIAQRRSLVRLPAGTCVTFKRLFPTTSPRPSRGRLLN